MNSYQKIGMKCDELEIEVAKLKSENRELVCENRDLENENRELRNENTDLVCWMQAQLVASNSFFKD
ncbi:bZIP transcription factor [Helicobacter pylori]|nr:bZIP transcription factor [Helicobacter pylori]